MSTTSTTVSVDDIYAAEERIRPFIHKTPMMTKTALSAMGNWSKGLFFKCESLQRTGSFKIRGSQNAVIKLLEKNNNSSTSNNNTNQVTKKSMTVICHSSGNHGQALARAARMNGQQAHIVVPRTAPKAKVAAMIENGAKITYCEPILKSREDAVKNLIDNVYGKDNAVFIHPFDNDDVIAGQGTCGLEMSEQFPVALHQRNFRDSFPSFVSSLDGDLNNNSNNTLTPVFIIPIGGGGLSAGCSLILRHKFPNAVIIGAEPEEADDAARSFESGKVEPLKQLPPKTMADGLMTTLAPRTLAIIRENIDGIITVSEKEIAQAVREIMMRLKIVIEPSAGVPAAVALFKRDEVLRRFSVVDGKKKKNLDAAVCVLCGGNADIPRLGKIVSKI